MDDLSLHLLAADCQALAAPLRLLILEALARDGEQTAALLAAAVRSSPSAVNGHLASLLGLGMVDVRGRVLARGRTVKHYRVCPERVERAAAAVAWLARLVRAGREQPLLPFGEAA